MSEVFLSIGSNREPQKNIPGCLQLLKEKFHLKKISSIYETDPVGPSGPQKFWNLAVLIDTGEDSKSLRKELAQIEKRLGRLRDPKNKFSARTIDLDILPSPHYQDRAFIMIPLAEIAPHEVDPETGKTFQEIAQGLETKKGIRRLHES